MQKFAIIGRNKKNISKLKKTLLKLGFAYSAKPEFIISLGGDGTFLYSERIYPGVPKILIRDSNICNKCSNNEFDELFMKIMLGNITIIEYYKLEATLNRKKYFAINDFIIRNKTPIHAIRFEVSYDDKTMQLIGDGVVVASPFGSTGYYYSITKKKFDNGIGLAFNNVTTDIKHKILHENTIVKIKLIRHDAHFTVDNDKKIMTIKKGEIVSIKKSQKNAKIIRVI